MPKFNPSIVGKLSGKMGDAVFVDSDTSDNHVRKAPRRRRKRIEAALKEQFSRTKMLNALAADINAIVNGHCPGFKSRNFYSNCLSRFRKASTDNRFLLLHALKNLNVHPKYTLNKLGRSELTFKQTRGQLKVEVEVTMQPDPGSFNADCYSIELVLIAWVKDKEGSKTFHQLSDWEMISGKKPVIEFVFNVPGMEHWVLLMRQRLGVNEYPVETFEGDGMQVMEAGTSNKKDLELLQKKIEESLPKKRIKPQEKVVRVKAKKYKD